MSLTLPTVTRWNSLYDSLKIIIINEEKLDELCSALSSPKFNITDIEYIKEYLQVMEPLVLTLDFLQRENNTIYGFLIPSLVTLITKYRKLSASGTLNHLNPHVIELEKALIDRFSKFFTLDESVNDAIVATILCPSIKTKW